MKKMAAVILLAACGTLLFTFCTKTNQPPGSPSPAATSTESMTPTVTSAPTATETPGGPHSVTIAGITFQWRVNGSYIDCTLTAATTGWIGVGFNNAAQMNGANIIIGYVSGTPVITDQKGGFHSHAIDTTDNITNKNGTESAGTTQLFFTIPLADDSNSQDFTLVPGNTYWLIVTNGSNGEDTATAPGMPANRGTVQINL